MALLLLLPGLASAGANTSNTTNTITLGSIHGAHTLGPVEVIYDWWRDHCMDGKCVAVRACRYHLPCRHSPLDKASVHQCITTLSSPVWARSVPPLHSNTHPFAPPPPHPPLIVHPITVRCPYAMAKGLEPSDWDVPDMPARMWRRANNETTLISSVNLGSRANIGPVEIPLGNQESARGH